MYLCKLTYALMTFDLLFRRLTTKSGTLNTHLTTGDSAVCLAGSPDSHGAYSGVPTSLNLSAGLADVNIL